jgi:hypothetical protein
MQFDLFKSTEKLIGVIQLPGKTYASARNKLSCSNGLRAILNELRFEWQLCGIDEIRKYDICLLAINSVMDIEESVFSISPILKGSCKIIVGGAGCISIRPLIPIIDVAVFGRAEGQINGIIEGETPANVWRKEIDPLFSGTYEMRQVQYLVGAEKSVGCRKKCLFCQYSWTRNHFSPTGSRYSDSKRSYEDVFESLNVWRSGVYTTALDGFSEKTRKRVGKNISDQMLVETISGIRQKSFDKAVILKVFNILWYPWETKSSVRYDIMHLRELLRSCDGSNGTRICFLLCLTPFSPEPLTPMAWMPANVFVDTIAFLNTICRRLYCGEKIEAIILPNVNTGFTLAKRVLINRGIGYNCLREVIRIGRRYKNYTDKMHCLMKYIDPKVFGEVEPDCHVVMPGKNLSSFKSA